MHFYPSVGDGKWQIGNRVFRLRQLSQIGKEIYNSWYSVMTGVQGLNFTLSECSKQMFWTKIFPKVYRAVLGSGANLVAFLVSYFGGGFWYLHLLHFAFFPLTSFFWEWLCLLQGQMSCCPCEVWMLTGKVFYSFHITMHDSGDRFEHSLHIHTMT